MNDDETMRDEAFEIVASVGRIAEILRDARLRVAARQGEGPYDATPFAGNLAKALLAAGGRLPDGNVNRLRWPVLETPRPLEDPRAYGAARELVTYLLACLGKGPGADQALEDAADVWPRHRTKASAELEVATIAQARANAIARRVAEEHARRLERFRLSSTPPPTGVLGAARAVVQAVVGAPRPPPPQAPGIEPRVPPLPTGEGRPDGAWVVGDDFSRDVPTVG